MPQSITRDWENLVYRLTEHVIDKIIEPNPLVTYIDGEPVEDDGALADGLHDFLCELIEEIESCSSFQADKQLGGIIKSMTKDSGAKDYVSTWE